MRQIQHIQNYGSLLSKIILQEPSRGSVVNIFQNKIKEIIEK